jgi:hypothetical protein
MLWDDGTDHGCNSLLSACHYRRLCAFYFQHLALVNCLPPTVIEHTFLPAESHPAAELCLRISTHAGAPGAAMHIDHDGGPPR